MLKSLRRIHNPIICSRAIITVLDNFGADANTDFDGYIRLGRESHRSSLLLVRTGDKLHFSALISFRISGQSLFLSTEVTLQ